jgi:hypothetical protein
MKQKAQTDGSGKSAVKHVQAMKSLTNEAEAVKLSQLPESQQQAEAAKKAEADKAEADKAAKQAEVKEAAKIKAEAEAEAVKKAVAERISERQTIREAIKGLPVLSLPLCTESGQTAILQDGSIQKHEFRLSDLSADIGRYLDKVGNNDTFFYVGGAVVKLPKGKDFGKRNRTFIKALTAAMFEKKHSLLTEFCTALRAKYDFPLINESGEFIATAETVLRGVNIHETAKAAVKNTAKKLTDGFGYNPAKIEVSAGCRQVNKLVKDGKYSEAVAKFGAVKSLEGNKLLN